MIAQYSGRCLERASTENGDRADQSSLPFHVRELRRHLPFAHGEHVHAAQVPRLPVPQLAIDPADDDAIAADDEVLGLEQRVKKVALRTTFCLVFALNVSGARW